MIDSRRTIRGGLCVMALVALLSACGGGSGSSAVPTSGGPTGNTGGNQPGGDTGGNAPAPIQGVATPSSVSVVTATNAN